MRKITKAIKIWIVPLITFFLGVTVGLLWSEQAKVILFLDRFGSPTIVGVGVIGDSNSDEYRADDNRGGEYAATTLNWVEQLALRRQLNFGPWGEWGEPRRTGYKYNWARSGATAESLIQSGQHIGLAQQVANGEVSHVLVWIGTNDFHNWNGTYKEVYDGDLNDAELQAKIDGIIANITMAVDTILKAGDTQMAIVTIRDPDFTTEFPDSAKRQRVTNAINAVNDGLKAMAAKREVIVVDRQEIQQRIVAENKAHIDEAGVLYIGEEAINPLINDNEPHHALLKDFHFGTVTSGLIANYFFIEPFNTGFGLDIAPLSDEEILENAGISNNSAVYRQD